jgi:predicted CoA-binding protein
VNDGDTIERLVKQRGTWAVVGLSSNPRRDALGVARVFRRLGKAIIPIHPRAEPVFGEPAYRRLADVPDGTTVDVVDCFVNSRRVGPVMDDAIAQRERLQIRAIWLQLNVVDDAAAARARDVGLDVVMDACPVIEARARGLLTTR